MDAIDPMRSARKLATKVRVESAADLPGGTHRSAHEHRGAHAGSGISGWGRQQLDLLALSRSLGSRSLGPIHRHGIHITPCIVAGEEEARHRAWLEEAGNDEGNQHALVVLHFSIQHVAMYLHVDGAASAASIERSAA